MSDVYIYPDWICIHKDGSDKGLDLMSWAVIDITSNKSLSSIGLGTDI